MILIDTNLLLYAYDSTSTRHVAARAWVEATFNSDERVGLGLQSILAFIRIGTNPTVFERPLGSSAAIAIVESWLARPNVGLAAPGERHWQILAQVAERGQARGPRLMDAHLAALSMEHGATLATTDRGFGRFAGLRFLNPIP